MHLVIRAGQILTGKKSLYKVIASISENMTPDFRKGTFPCTKLLSLAINLGTVIELVAFLTADHSVQVFM